ncbi:hypothetical protein ACS0TY_002537 [Phlomoides rotata]
MSVFGGDSWAREAQCRKRRVDDLMIEGIEASAYKKLSDGKFYCLVCPNNPVLDSPVMLSTHVSGSRHRAAELRRKDRELAMREEVNKRLAFSDCVSTNASKKQSKATIKPLIERARKAASEVLYDEVGPRDVTSERGDLVMPRIGEHSSNANPIAIEAIHKEVVREVQPLYCRELQEKVLKFTAAGWKRDCHGRWFKDENVSSLIHSFGECWI